MRVGIAQIRPIKGDLIANINAHKALIDKAVRLRADALFFSELSLTGYEPELANALATTPNDPRFQVFEQLSQTHRITLGVGLPIRTDTGIQISMVVFRPDAPRQTYAKQLLHADELPYFVAGQGQLILSLGELNIAPAICYESLQPQHAEQVHVLGADVYVASVAKSLGGIEKAYQHYPVIAQTYAMPVLMSNCVGYCDNFEAVGSSAIWNQRGELVARLNETEEGVLVWDSELGEVVRETC
jgi:predicted amidohydrolase